MESVTFTWIPTPAALPAAVLVLGGPPRVK